MTMNVRVEDHHRQNGYTPTRPSMPLKTRTVPDENVEDEEETANEYAQIGKLFDDFASLAFCGTLG